MKKYASARFTANLKKQMKLHYSKYGEQTKLARKAEITTAALSYLKQQKTVPSLDTACKLCNALGVSIEDMLQ